MGEDKSIYSSHTVKDERPLCGHYQAKQYDDIGSENASPVRSMHLFVFWRRHREHTQKAGIHDFHYGFLCPMPLELHNATEHPQLAGGNEGLLQ